MVWLDSVGSEHGLFSGRVFGHEIVGTSETNLGLSVVLEIVCLSNVFVTLGFGELLVLCNTSFVHGLALGVMVLLGLL